MSTLFPTANWWSKWRNKQTIDLEWGHIHPSNLPVGEAPHRANNHNCLDAGDNEEWMQEDTHDNWKPLMLVRLSGLLH